MRKSNIYLAFSILCLGVFIIICLIINLPDTLLFNALRLFVCLLGVVSFILYNNKKNEELDEESFNDIKNLKEKYGKYLLPLVIIHTKLIYGELDEEFIKTYMVSIDNSDNYLITLENYFEKFKQNSLNSKINNDFIVISCVMNSLISNWKIKTSIPNKIATIDGLILTNCKLAVSVALSLMDLSYENLEDHPYIKRLMDLLYLSYYDSTEGTTSMIESEAMILELLFIEFNNN